MGGSGGIGAAGGCGVLADVCSRKSGRGWPLRVAFKAWMVATALSRA